MANGKDQEAPSAGKRRPEPQDLVTALDLISEKNISLRAACREIGIHPGHTVAELKADNDLWAQYARAREARGESFAEDVVTVAQMVLAGKVKPEQGRVAMDGYKWAAGRMAPKAYGDRTVLEHTGKDGEALPVAPAPVTFIAVYPGKREPS